jgi:glycosyltransferase involved in cell wall biosynthesis
MPDRLRAAMTVEQCWQPVPGGSARYITALGRALVAGGQVDLRGVAARHSSPPEEDWALDFPVHHHRLPRPALYELWQRTGRPDVRGVTGPVDVIHATTWAVPPRTAPLVVTVHDLAFLHDPGHFTRRGNAYFRRALDQVRVHADVVITPSRQTADDCLRVGIPADRIRVVPHGHDPVVLPDGAAAAFLESRGLQRPYVLWAGTREPRKNLPRLLEAFELLRASCDVDLVLVGPSGWGPDGQGLPDDDRVHVLGRLSDRELHCAYAGARVFCYPSVREGFGFPVLEAMSHGVPVVTSHGTPMEDTAGPAGISVDPEDARHLADALRRALGEEHDTLADEARRRADTFSWTTAARETVAAYSAAVS